MKSVIQHRYLVVVALPSKVGNQPNLLNLSAFVANGDQVVTVKPGIYYHSIVCLDGEGDFIVLVWLLFSFYSLAL
jgi:ureidoglycolate hydrolase